MRILGTTISVLALSATVAGAGGLDRSGQGVGVIFKDGNWAELSFGNVNPSISGAYTGFGNVATGDMAESYNQLGAAIKFDLGSNLSAAIIFDQPWGSNVSYPASAFTPTAGSTAEFNSRGITALAKYQVNENVSVLGGIRQNTIDMSVSLPDQGGFGPALAYTATGAPSSAMGYVIGAAYEIPDIALRASLTYSSETNHKVTTTETVGGVATTSTTPITMPKSVNLDFQTGVAADTLVTFGVRWANWSATTIDPAAHRANRGSSLLNYTEDTYTWSLGVGRRISDSFAGSATLGWERPLGGNSPNLGPVDGNVSLSLGGAYTINNMEISGGVRYVKLGDATTDTAGANFTDNSAIALGLKVGFSF
jgi:long-chain fatty acid transport protein